MYILGVNAAYHESSACLLKNGEVIAAAEEERFNRIKHGKKLSNFNNVCLPMNAIQYCLEEASIGEPRKLSLEDIDHIGYSIEPIRRFVKNVQHRHPYSIDKVDFGTYEAENIFKEMNENMVNEFAKFDFKGEFHWLGHHESHAASAFFVSPFDEAAVLVIDGIGEYESTTFYSGKGNEIKIVGAINYPNSIGFLWEKICKFLGFGMYDACKLMGLASYGRPDIYLSAFSDIIEYGNGDCRINDEIIQFRIDSFKHLEEVFKMKKLNHHISDVDSETQKYADIAASLQHITENIIISFCKKLKDETQFDNLCLAGGVALNCSVNGVLCEKGIFKNIFIQPAANDAGTSMGAAFYVWNQIKKKPRTYVFKNAYLGPMYSKFEIVKALNKKGLIYRKVECVEQYAAKLLAEGKIISWFQGRMEWGPRALGNRSILADPRRKEMVELLNTKTKYREPFRPFCPSILSEKFEEWFKEPLDSIRYVGNYMLTTNHVIPQKKSKIPAVVHIDNTSRVQLVRKNENPLYHSLIEHFERFTKIPLVLNTSFNSQEPIVCTPEDAVKTFLGSDIDYLIMGDFVVSREDNAVEVDFENIYLKEYLELLR